MQIFKNKFDKDGYLGVAYLYIVIITGWYFMGNTKPASFICPIAILIISLQFLSRKFFKKYIIDEDNLILKSLLNSTVIKIQDIKSIKRKRLHGFSNRSNSSSKDILEINYRFSSIIYISPINQKELVDAILLINSNIEVQIDNIEVEIKFLRSRMIILSIFSIFIIYILLKLIVPIFLATESDLIAAEGKVKLAFWNTYVTSGRRSALDTCIDIHFANGIRQVRITNNYQEYSTALLDSNINGRPIQIKVYPWRPLNYLVFNPEKLTIDNKVIIPFKAHSFQKGFLVLIFTALPTFLILAVTKSNKLYRKYLLSSDQLIRQESTWKYIRLWIFD
jgi:hypothetical protein